MDKQLSDRIMDAVEDLLIENLALRSLLLSAHRNVNKEQVDSLIFEAKGHSGVRESVRARLRPLREKLQSDTALELVLQDFLRIVPLPKDVN